METYSLIRMTQPVGELKTLISLVDRTDFDEYVYPKGETSTKFQPNVKPYHNYTHEVVSFPFTGSPNWGQRITFSLPWPYQGDFLTSITLRLKPMSWLPRDAQQHIGPDVGDWEVLDPDNFWIWANSLGTIAIERAEMEVDGVVVETLDGDWMNVVHRTSKTISSGISSDDATASYTNHTVYNFLPSEDGYIYCPLPFWFSKHVNTAFPMVSCSAIGPDRIRFHITLRPFSDVVRKLVQPKSCDETPLGTSFQVRDYSFPFRKFQTVSISRTIPGFETADILCGISHIDGELRTAYLESPHELLMEPVVETVFAEPLKYTINTSAKDVIKIGLPLTEANGPLRQILFFLRRTSAIQKFNDWNNYSAMLENEVDPTWNPEQPLLVRGQLMVGTAVWVDEDERWWRASGNLPLPGGIRSYGNYIYVYNFAEHPNQFSPSGSINASRVDLRLHLTVRPPKDNSEWSVSVFLVGTNWIRFQNGMANLIFMD